MSDKAQKIRERAHQLWQEQGEPEGLETDHWLQAEQELNEEDSISGGANEGEGSQAGARSYNEATAAFVESGKVEAAAAGAVASVNDPAQLADMQQAEKIGKSRRRR